MFGNFTTLCMKRLIVYDTSNYYIKGSSHWVKSVQIRSFLWFVFSCIRTEYGDLRSTGKYGLEKTVSGHFPPSAPFNQVMMAQ